MVNMRKLLLCLALPLLALCGCTKTRGLTGPEGPAGGLLKGNIIGFVDLFDEYGTLSGSLDGVKVYIEGTTDTVQTNNYGAFEIDSVKTGTYAIVFKKPGYGDARINSFQFVGGNNTYVTNHIAMSQVPDFFATSVSITSGTNNLILTGNFN